MFYSGAQKPVSVAENLTNDTVQSIYYGDEYVGLVYISNESSNRYRLDVYHKSGELKQSIEFDMEYRDILFHNDQIIIYNESECSIYSIGGTEKYSGQFEKTVLVLIPQNNAYRYMVVTPESVDTVELQ